MSFRTKDRRPLKQGINAEESRLKRVDQQVSLRRQIREENLNKKRNVTGDDGSDPSSSSLSTGPSSSTVDPSRSAQMKADIAERLRQLPQMMEAVMSNDPRAQIEAVTAFRKLLSSNAPLPSRKSFNAESSPASSTSSPPLTTPLFSSKPPGPSPTSPREPPNTRGRSSNAGLWTSSSSY